jgi:hypothetical protein
MTNSSICFIRTNLQQIITKAAVPVTVMTAAILVTVTTAAVPVTETTAAVPVTVTIAGMTLKKVNKPGYFSNF